MGKTNPTWDKRYPLLDRLYQVFKITIDKPRVATITDGCDGVFSEDLSADELRELAQYFDSIANEMEAE